MTTSQATTLERTGARLEGAKCGNIKVRKQNYRQEVHPTLFTLADKLGREPSVGSQTQTTLA